MSDNVSSLHPLNAAGQQRLEVLKELKKSDLLVKVFLSESEEFHALIKSRIRHPANASDRELAAAFEAFYDEFVTRVVNEELLAMASN